MYIVGNSASDQKRENFMSTYTPKAIATLEAAQPLNIEKAKAIASDLGVSYRSVISKAKQLGLEYVAKTAATKTVATEAKETKADIVSQISAIVGKDFVALDKANTADLEVLRTFVQATVTPIENDSEVTQDEKNALIA